MYKKMNPIFLVTLLGFLGILAQGVLIVDEEMILIISVLIFLGSSYNAVSSFLISSLNDRAESIKKVFDTYFILKINTLNSLLATYEKIYNTNKDLVNVIGVTAKQLQHIQQARNKEVDFFLNYVVNSQLNIILAEEINLVKTVYYNKIKLFFSSLLGSWKLYSVHGLVSSSITGIFDDFEKASKVINENKVSLLPLSSVVNSDILLLQAVSRIILVLEYIVGSNNVLISYVLSNYVFSVKGLSRI